MIKWGPGKKKNLYFKQMPSKTIVCSQEGSEKKQTIHSDTKRRRMWPTVKPVVSRDAWLNKRDRCQKNWFNWSTGDKIRNSIIKCLYQLQLSTLFKQISTFFSIPTLFYIPLKIYLAYNFHFFDNVSWNLSGNMAEGPLAHQNHFGFAI